MKKQIDIKSAVLGAIAGVLAVLSIAAATSQNLTVGRFQLMGAQNHIFKIDSTTGQVWSAFVSETSGDFEKPVIGSDATTLEAEPSGRQK